MLFAALPLVEQYVCLSNYDANVAVTGRDGYRHVLASLPLVEQDMYACDE